MLLVDADPIAYRVAFSVEYSSEVFPKLKELMDDMFLSVYPVGPYEAYLTGSGNFRDDIATTVKYKGERSSDPPAMLPVARHMLVEEYGAVVVDGIEADDIISIRANELDFNCIVASIDKDFYQLPCKHYNYTSWINLEYTKHIHGDNKVNYFTQTEEGAKVFKYRQMLTGDRVDNIKGVYNIGPRKAEAMIQEGMSELEMWNVVVDAHGSYDRALEDARLLHLLTKEGELWEPPKE